MDCRREDRAAAEDCVLKNAVKPWGLLVPSLALAMAGGRMERARVRAWWTCGVWAAQSEIRYGDEAGLVMVSELVGSELGG